MGCPLHAAQWTASCRRWSSRAPTSPPPVSHRSEALALPEEEEEEEEEKEEKKEEKEVGEQAGELAEARPRLSAAARP